MREKGKILRLLPGFSSRAPLRNGEDAGQKLGAPEAVQLEPAAMEMADPRTSVPETAAGEIAAPEVDRSALRAQRLENRAQREARRIEKAGATARPERLCTLATLEVRKGEEGYQITLSGEGRHRRLVIALDEAASVLRDLDTAIKVIRGRQ